MTNVNHHLQDELFDTLQKVVEDSVVYHNDSQSGESFRECVVCGEWDDHLSTCPIPTIERWIKINEDK